MGGGDGTEGGSKMISKGKGGIQRKRLKGPERGRGSEDGRTETVSVAGLGSPAA